MKTELKAETELEILIKGARLDRVKTMNSLQGAGVVSDNAVTAADVVNADAQAAWDFLRDIAKIQRAKNRAKYPD